MQFSYLPKIRTTYFLSVQEPHLRFFSRIGCPVSKDFYRLVKPKKYKRNYMRDTLFDSPLFVGLLTTVTYQPLLAGVIILLLGTRGLRWKYGFHAVVE